MNDEGSSDLSLKDAYAEIGTNYRYFLTWRARLFAGYLTVLAALSVAYWTVRSDANLQKIIVAVPIALTIVFWMLDLRNRHLYHACQHSGQACEKYLPEGAGIYTRFGTDPDVRRRRITQSLALDVFFLIVLLASIAAGIYL